MRCIFCGCTEHHACEISLADLSPDVAAQFRERHLIVTAAGQPALGDGVVACWWVLDTPPVCSAPNCVAELEAVGARWFAPLRHEGILGMQVL